MGTCYLSYSYKNTRRLFKEYVGEDALIEPGGGPTEAHGKLLLPAPRLQASHGNTILTSDEWIYATREENKLPSAMWDIVPDRFQAVGLYLDVHKYRALHESLLGIYDYHGLPPRPSPETMRRLNITFRDLLLMHGLKPLLDLCCIGFGSYGYGYDVPAIYGLWFVTPIAVEAFLYSKVNPERFKTIETTRNGFYQLWKNMIKRHGVKIQYESNIASINRNLHNPKRPIVIKMQDPKVQPIECDFLIFAAPMNTAFLPLVKDATPFEREVCSHYDNAGLCVTVFKTPKKKPFWTAKDGGAELEDQALTFYPESLQREFTPVPKGEVYAERNAMLAHRWDDDVFTPNRFDVAYQYFRQPSKDGTRNAALAAEFIADKEKVINPTPPSNVVVPGGKRSKASSVASSVDQGRSDRRGSVGRRRSSAATSVSMSAEGGPSPCPYPVLIQKNWQNYFPHMNREGVQRYLPWRIMEYQGRARTFYIGSSVSFESVEDVVKYNLQVLKLNAFQS